MKPLNHSKELTALCLSQFRTENAIRPERRRSPRSSWRNAFAIADSHSREVCTLESLAFADLSRKTGVR